MNSYPTLTSLCIFMLSFFFLQAQAQEEISIRTIYADTNYNAFSSIIKFKGRYYCAFRSGERHVYGKDGVAKVITSKDGIKWKEAVNIAQEGIDLRDPKLSVTPDGRIMLVVGGSIYQGKKLLGRVSKVAFSNKRGKKFSELQDIILDPAVKGKKDWLWRVSWYQGSGYGVLYDRMDRTSALVKTEDGIRYELVSVFGLSGFPTEATVRFLPNGDMRIMHRQDGGDKMGYWGESKAPYTDWKWKAMDMRLGGPDFEILSDGSVLAATRIYREEGPYTALMSGDVQGNFHEIYRLPSGGDCSYPGIVEEEDRILVSYYSSHEGKARIYLAEVPKAYLLKIRE